MTTPDMPYTWGELVESDCVFSTRANRWFEVVETVRNTATGMVRLMLRNVDTGNVVRQEKTADNLCGPVKRGATGKAVDIFVEVMSSGPA